MSETISGKQFGELEKDIDQKIYFTFMSMFFIYLDKLIDGIVKWGWKSNVIKEHIEWANIFRMITLRAPYSIILPCCRYSLGLDFSPVS